MTAGWTRLLPAGVLVLVVAAGILAANARPLAAQLPRVPDAPNAPHATPGSPAAAPDRQSALAQIDRVAMHAAALVRGHVPDRAGTTIWILPFTTDTGAATRFGHRLQSAVHLRLLSGYGAAQIRVAPRRPYPAGTDRAEQQLPAGAVTARLALELEMQPFRDTLRVVLRVLSSGVVSAGDWIDLTVNDELLELLDGTGDAAQPGRARRAAAAAAAGADTAREQPRTPLPSAITVDRGQQRYTTSGEDWVTLQVPAPGFYLLEGRSFSGPLTLSLHYDRDRSPVVTAREDTPSAAGGTADGLPRGVDRRLGIFASPRRSYARISTASDEDVAFYLRLRPLHPPRRFADATVYTVPLERGTGFQTLRVFRSGVYRVTAEADSGDLQLRVFGVPHMGAVQPSRTAPAPGEGAVTGSYRYELAAGDYLVEVTSEPAATAARMCWAAADTTGGCQG